MAEGFPCTHRPTGMLQDRLEAARFFLGISIYRKMQ